VIKSVLFVIWLVVTYLSIREREIEMSDSNQTSVGGSSWFRVWSNPEMSGDREGIDYVDILADTPEGAVQDSDQYLPVGGADSCHAVRMGAAEDYAEADEPSWSLVVLGDQSDWDMDDVAELVPRSSD
jgi:hypothetical protein